MSPAEERREAYVFLAFIAAVVLAGASLVVLARRDVYPGIPRDARPLALRGVTLFDGTGRPPRDAAVVVIEGERIRCVGDCTIPADARIVEGDGLACLPGLIDLNVHLGSYPESEGASAFGRMLELARQRPRPRRALHEGGVTAIRELGNMTDTIFTLKAEVAAGRLAGPDVFAAGPMFTAPGGIPAGTDFGNNTYAIERATRQVDEPEAARAAVRRLVRDGADGIAAVVDGGILDRLPRLAPDVLRAIVEEAHAHDRWVAASTGRIRDVRDAVQAGVDTIELGAFADSPLDPETITLLRTHDVTYVPTLTLVELFLRRVEREAPPPGYPVEPWENLQRTIRQRGMAKALEPMFESVRAAARAGVRIGVGTANGTAFGASLHRELELLVQAGLSPGDALLGATQHAARALRQNGEQGTVETGKLANLVLVAGRPWVHIEDVRAIRLVIERGRVVVGAS